MAKKVFISFDYDHDKNLYGNLVHQADQPDSPFTISDSSLQAPVVNENWKRVARDRIERAELVIFICGENTHSARGVEAEMSITRAASKQYILLKGRRHTHCTRPKNASHWETMHPWTWHTLKQLIG